MNMKLHNTTMQEALKELPDNSVDSIVTDPPYGIDFMGKSWDYDVPSVEMWQECLRVLKPGGHLLSFSSARTYHRMAVFIEDAGFEIRDQVMWCYGSGFPKSHNIGKAYDKKHNRVREDMGANPNNRPNQNNIENATHDYGTTGKSANITKGDGPFEGWGTALKPSHEPICVARKPLSEKTVLANMEKWGVGGLNIDASRVPNNGETFDHVAINKSDLNYGVAGGANLKAGGNTEAIENLKTMGRWPANLIHDGLWDSEDYGKFFYVPKVSKKERNEGLDAFEEGTYSNDGRETTNDTAYQRGYAVGKNTHPTVKPIELMHYLIRMATPAGGTTLDPFMGSGSTGCAAMSNGYDFIGVEMEEHSFKTAKARVEYWSNK